MISRGQILNDLKFKLIFKLIKFKFKFKFLNEYDIKSNFKYMYDMPYPIFDYKIDLYGQILCVHVYYNIIKIPF